MVIRKILRESRFCKCGCKQTFECKINSKQQFINGHYQKTEAFKFDMKKKAGRKNNYPHSIELSKIKSNNCKNLRLQGKLNGWPKGKRHSNKTRKQISDKLKGKSKIELFGEKRAQLIIKKISQSLKGKSYEQLMGKDKSYEVKLQKRITRIKQIEQNYGICFPNYNPKACEFFKSFDDANNTKGHYAMCGGGELQISELGYFPDYINFEKKLIIEYDEPHHYDESGNLKEKDRIRQREIQKHFSDFRFERIKGDEYGKRKARVKYYLSCPKLSGND